MPRDATSFASGEALRNGRNTPYSQAMPSARVMIRPTMAAGQTSSSMPKKPPVLSVKKR